jgi:hypothetical protein
MGVRMNKAASTAFLSLALQLGWPSTATAEIFNVRCSIEGSLPALEDKKFPAAEVSIEIQSIGNNLYFKMQGAKPYEMFINTLTTELFAKEQGAESMMKILGYRSERKKAEPLIVQDENINFQKEKKD